MDTIKKNETFYVEGTGRAQVVGEDGKVGLIHLQDATFEASSKSEDIYGGETNTSLFNFQTEKDLKVTFTNASMNSQTVALTQGAVAKKKGKVFASDEEVKVGTDGTVTLAHADTADMDTVTLADDEGNVVAFANGKVDTSYANQTLKATYAYVKDGVIGVDVKTTSVPGYVKIFFRSKPLKQKDGRIIRINMVIYKARSDGSLKIDFKHKNAFAPELTFNIVDPEREDNLFWSYTLEDVTNGEANNQEVVTPKAVTPNTDADAQG